MTKEPARERSQKRSSCHQPSHLFLLRVWIDPKSEHQGTEDMSGKVQDPVSGHVEFFDSAIELVRTLRRMIARKRGKGPSEDTAANQL